MRGILFLVVLFGPGGVWGLASHAAESNKPLVLSTAATEAPERLTGAIEDSNSAQGKGSKTNPGSATVPADVPDGKLFSRPVIVPLPAATAGVVSPVISLDGTWKFTLKPPAEFWSNGVDPAKWSDIAVPGEAVMQGFDVQGYDQEYSYKRTVAIPADFSGKRVFLRFDGVYTYARVWVNGQFVRDHHGGFTSWNCEITDRVTPGQTAWLTVGVSDAKLDEYIQNMSSYARHSLLGITRSVRLFAAPADHATRFHVEADFDASYVNATLKATCAMAFHKAGSATVLLTLKDPRGGVVALNPASLTLSQEKPEATLCAPVASPLKWDAEHPNLYTLEASVIVDGAVVQALSKKVGFRKVELKDCKLLVNGVNTKLRGVAMHDAHALAGRAVSPEMTASAIRMFKQANVNYLRMSHYPRADEFYDLCDEIGMYVEDDAALVHDGFDLRSKSPDSIALGTWAEQVESHRSHPSIILWALGNETPVGTRIPKMRDYLAREDSSRILVWPSYNKSPNPTIIHDQHYPGATGNFGGRSFATIYNEFAHVTDYCVFTIKRDPNIRNYWGVGMKMFWEGMYPAEGCLGGAIWSAIDDVFYYPPPRSLQEMTAKQSQGGEWGIIDGWRRAKPEYWLVKKAFSPVRIKDEPLARPADGRPLSVAVSNWFNHANLNEVSIRWAVGQESGTLPGPDVAPGGSGTFMIPARAWRAGEILNLKFDWPGMMIDEYNLPVGGSIKKVFPAASGPAPKVTEDTASITVTGKGFAVVFNKATGTITKATYGGTNLIEGGPELNLAPVVLSGWSLSSLSHATTPTQAVITLAGRYEKVEIEGWKDKIPIPGQKSVYYQKPSGPVGVVFVVKIDGQGLITTEFTVTNPPLPNASQYGNTGYDEVGVTYLLPSGIDRIHWERKGLWSAYPADHIGRNRGTATRSGQVPVYRQEPSWPWSQDEKTFYYFGAEDKGGRGSNDFRSTKENVWFYSAQLAGSNKRVRVESDATAAVRSQVAADGRIELRINTVLGYPSLQWGNYCPIVKIPSGYAAGANLRLTDNDACDSVVEAVCEKGNGR